MSAPRAWTVHACLIKSRAGPARGFEWSFALSWHNRAMALWNQGPGVNGSHDSPNHSISSGSLPKRSTPSPYGRPNGNISIGEWKERKGFVYEAKTTVTPWFHQAQLPSILAATRFSILVIASNLPRSILQGERYPDFANFYPQFIKNYNVVAAHLTALTSQKVPFWQLPAADKEFGELLPIHCAGGWLGLWGYCEHYSCYVRLTVNNTENKKCSWK